MLQVSRLRSHETEVPYVSQNHWEEKELAATLSDTEPEDDSDNEDDGILNAFTTTVNLTEGIIEDVDEKEELVESKFEKMDEQDDIHITYAKLYKVFEKYENLYRLATKKFMKNVSAKGFDKDRKQSSSLQFKSQDKGKKDARNDGQYTIPSGPKCFRCQGFGHMKQKCHMYLKTIGKRRNLLQL